MVKTLSYSIVYDGNYNLWIKFRDTFELFIYNNDTLTNIEKFHYLKLFLKGTAARIIHICTLSDILVLNKKSFYRFLLDDY